MLELRRVDHAVGLGDADDVAEGADRPRRVAAPAQAGEGGHARVVPAVDVALLDELQQPALGEHGVGQVEARELDLVGARREAEVVDQPVVDVAVVLELQRAQRVGDLLEGVRQRMGEVVHRVDRPLVAGAVVVGVADAVEQRVAHLHVGRRHVDLRAQHVGTVGELAGSHAAQQVEVLRHRAVAVGALAARLQDRAAVLLDLLVVEAVDVGLAGEHQPLGALVEPLEVVGREVQRVPLEAEPAHVALDRLDVLHVLGQRVGVVEAQVAGTAVLAGDAEVEADRLGVADVQVAVGLRWKAGGHAAAVGAAREVVVDPRADEVESRAVVVGLSHGRLPPLGGRWVSLRGSGVAAQIAAAGASTHHLDGYC